MKIHQTAIIEKGAKIASDVEIGAYSIIGPHVEIGPGSVIGAHTVITGHTLIGRDNRIFQFASVGEIPQDKKYGQEETKLEIGDRNLIREFCTLNTGTVQGGGVTRIGSDNWIMAYVHIAHDCQVGSHVTFSNNASLAGHAEIGDWAVLGGFTLIHQFCRIGSHVMIGMGSGVTQDIPPFVTAAGHPAKPYGINSEGLKRRQFSSEQLLHLKHAYKILYKSGLSLKEAEAELLKRGIQNQDIKILAEFIGSSQRGIIR
ncbi:MAG: acyl-ACP--UDP-N-acetylglucosamine O-acyltransferase [Proteobacteria bacterium]|nr:acyl-ACP--UDP-N-acetylglucosamine O-acyltransferase [Pseudomonadota bacterium]MDE3208987.1 acyl-ACP--UDP-N-acetylglucosamine O-acyltransferase [Pseudomonadota bacterium]